MLNKANKTMFFLNLQQLKGCVVVILKYKLWRFHLNNYCNCNSSCSYFMTTRSRFVDDSRNNKLKLYEFMVSGYGLLLS